MVGELRAAGRSVDVEVYDESRLPPAGSPLLRLSDPLMLRAARAMTAAGVAYRGPGAAALERCYDKLSAYRAVAAHAIECPETRPVHEAGALARPVVLKPRRGSDSLGVRIVRNGTIPAHLENDVIAQAQILGTELTVGVIAGTVGKPLRLLLPEGVPYTFLRKYVLRPRREVVHEEPLAGRVAETAARVVSTLGADWAVRVDFILERGTGRLVFLECDAAPLVGPASAFAHSLAGAGIRRDVQLARLLGEA